MTCSVEVIREADAWSGVADVEEAVERAARAAWDDAARPHDAELNVLLCDDERIRALNLSFRGQDKPTNVLSFPAAPRGAEPGFLGDIAIAWQTTRREAEDEGKPVAAHLSHLVVHGVLHLLGHDHLDAAQAEAMEAAERRILARLGVADPYAGADLAVEAHPQ